MKNMTISKKLSFVVLPIVFFCLVLFGIVLYLHVSNVIKDDVSNNILKTVQEKSTMVDVWVKTHLIEVESIAQTPAAKNINAGFDAIDAVNRNRFVYFKNNYPKDYTDIYSANSQGVYHTFNTVRTDSSLAPTPGNIKNRGYFQSIMSGGPAQVTSVLISRATGKPTIFMVAPITSDSGIPQGLIGAGIQMTFILDTVKALKVNPKSYGLALAEDGTILGHPDDSIVMKKKITEIDNGGLVDLFTYVKGHTSGIRNYVYKGVDKTAFFAKVPSTGWIVMITTDQDTLFAEIYSTRNLLIGLTLSIMSLVAFVLFLLGRTITKPIRQVVEGLQDIAEGEGDLTRRLASNSRDETGEVVKWFNAFAEKIQYVMTDIQTNIATLNTSADNLVSLSEGVAYGANDASSRSEKVTMASEGMKSNMAAVAAASEEASINVNMVASAAEEMSVTVNEIAGNTLQAREVTASAVQKTGTATQRMDELGDAAQEISKVTETITEISEQTNLLALNATIEAARAGEAGKGFAVVANEIKELAKQTAEATLEIRERIAAIQSSTTLTVKEMDEINTVINEVNDIVSTIATAVEEQSASTQEIATNVSQAALGIGEVNENVSESSTVASDISEEIKGVSSVADSLKKDGDNAKAQAGELLALSERLNSIVNQFKL